MSIVSGEREVWKYSVIIEATAEDAVRVGEAISQALCPDNNHEGPCEVPWTMMRSRFEDLDDEERRLWKDDLADDRRHWEDGAI